MTTVAPVPKDEAARLAALEELLILDTAEEPVFDAIAALAASICETPIALISLIDRDRQWFKARVGLDVRETPREVAFCAHAIVDPDPTEIRDASVDPRFFDNPLVTGDPDIRFYAGRPLRDDQGHALGSLCVIDRVPRQLTQAQHDAMEHLAMVVMRLFEARRENERAKSALRKSEARIRTIADNLPAGINYIDTQGRYQFNNSIYSLWLDRPLDQITGRTLKELHTARSFEQIEPYLERGLSGLTTEFELTTDFHGEPRYFRGSYIPDRDSYGRVVGVYGLILDATELVLAQGKLKRLAQHDSLTGLANRNRLNEILAEVAARGRRHGLASALLYLDIDHFKQINDSHGHAAGDAVLREFARRLLDCVRETDTVARLGGDEFVIVLEDLHNSEGAIMVAGKIREAMRTPFELETASIDVGVSIGIAVARLGESTPETLLQRADRALYQVKASGRGDFLLAEDDDAAES